MFLSISIPVRRRAFAVYFCLGLLGLASGACGADSTADPGLFQLGTVSVYGSKPSDSDLLPVQVGAATIALLGTRDVAEALATLPGVTLTRIGARNETSVFVRGFGSTQVPIFIDGIPAYVPYDGYVDLGRFTTYDVAAISVSEGYSSVLYGPNTMGGAINLISRRPRSAFEGEFYGGVFSGEGREISLNLGARRKVWYAEFGASHVDQNTYPLSGGFTPVASQPAGDRLNADHSDRKVSAKVAYTPNAADEYAVGFVRQEGEKGTPPYTGTAAGMLRYWRWPEWNKQTLYFVSSTRIGETGYVKPRLYYDWYDNALDQYTDATYSVLRTGPFGPSQYHDHSCGGSVEAGSSLFTGNMLKAALYDKFDYHNEHVDGQPHYQYEDRTVSAALEDTWHAGSSVDLQVGASYDSRQALRADQVNPDGTPVGLTTFDSFNPEAGLFWKDAGGGVFHATVAHKSRFPTIKDRYSYRFNTAFPNPDLRPETVVHFELGYEGTVAAGLTAHANVYDSRIHDAIQSVSDVDGTTRSQIRNVGSVDNRGCDLGLEYARGEWLRVGASYTYVDQHNLTDPSVKITDVPRSSGRLYAEIRPVRRLEIVPDVAIASWRYTYSDGRTVAGYTVAGLKLVGDLGRGVSASAGIRNIFDKAYQLQDGYPEAGRTLYANLRYTF